MNKEKNVRRETVNIWLVFSQLTIIASIGDGTGAAHYLYLLIQACIYE